MTWTMPRPLLTVVAWLIGLSAVSSFALGIYNASAPARLPGEGPAGKAGSAAPIQAMEATPLSQERIEGPPPAPELTEAEKLKLAADRQAKAEAEAQAKLAAAELEKQKAAEAAALVQPLTPPPVAASPAPAQPAPEEPPF
jgi:hypothetical protein